MSLMLCLGTKWYQLLSFKRKGLCTSNLWSAACLIALLLPRVVNLVFIILQRPGSSYGGNQMQHGGS